MLLCTSLGPCPAGMKLANLSKILKCAGNDDAITMKSEDNGDTITFMFESPSEPGCAARWSAAGCLLEMSGSWLLWWMVPTAGAAPSPLCG